MNFKSFRRGKKAQVKPEEWTLKQFAEHVFNQKGTTRALNYLIKYKNQLDVLRGGFIDYGSTHNGWHIPSHEIQKFIIEHGLN